MWMLKLIPDLSFYCSHFSFCMKIPLDGLLNISPGFCQNCNFLFWAIFFNCVFSLSVCGSIRYKVDCSHFQWSETWHADLPWPTSELSRFWSQSVDFPHFGNILVFLNETGQIWGFLGFLWKAKEKWPIISHADVTWPPLELNTFWSRSIDFPYFGGILT